VWTAHWGLNHDPFLERGAPYVPLPGHEEAVARLLHVIDSGQRLAVLRGAGGIGKSRVLHRALSEARLPARRFAFADANLDDEFLPNQLARALGARSSGLTSRGRDSGWAALERALRVCGHHGQHAILAIDRGAAPATSSELNVLPKLLHMPGGDAVPVTVVLTARRLWEPAGLSGRSWSLAIRLRPVSYSEVGD
jgi:hypothetical protein